jgi:hypothetical protein
VFWRITNLRRFSVSVMLDGLTPKKAFKCASSGSTACSSSSLGSTTCASRVARPQKIHQPEDDRLLVPSAYFEVLVLEQHRGARVDRDHAPLLERVALGCAECEWYAPRYLLQHTAQDVCDTVALLRSVLLRTAVLDQRRETRDVVVLLELRVRLGVVREKQVVQVRLYIVRQLVHMLLVDGHAYASVTPRFASINFIKKTASDRAQNTVFRHDLVLARELVAHVYRTTHSAPCPPGRKNLPLAAVLHARRARQYERLAREAPNAIYRHGHATACHPRRALG